MEDETKHWQQRSRQGFVGSFGKYRTSIPLPTASKGTLFVFSYVNFVVNTVFGIEAEKCLKKRSLESVTIL
jgi:hypothetical protein